VSTDNQQSNGETPIQQFERLVGASLNEMKLKTADPEKLKVEIMEFAEALISASNTEAQIELLEGLPTQVHQRHASHTNHCIDVRFRNAEIKRLKK